MRGDDPLPKDSNKIDSQNNSDDDLYDPGRGAPAPGVWFRAPRELYYRYKLMTGVYMLGQTEEIILHFFFFLGMYFSVTYGLQFYSEYKGWLPKLGI